MYSRFTALEVYGRKELERLQNSTAAVVGLGATGSVIAEHLARTGVNLVIIDRDYLEENDIYSSNIYTKGQVEKSLPKAEAARSNLSQFTEVEKHVESLGPGNVELLDADIVLDGTDNLETRFLIDEYCRREDIPWVYTAAIARKGYSMLFDTECFSCVFKKVKAGSLETCESAGIDRTVATETASKSARKAMERLAGKEVRESLEKVPEGEKLNVESSGCEVCREERFPRLESSDKTVAICGENKFQIDREIDRNAFQKLKDSGEVKAENDYLVRVETEKGDFTLFRSGRAIVEARDKGHAEALFDELIGN